MCESEKRLFVNGTTYKKGNYSDEDAYTFVPFIKVVKVLRFDAAKECYGVLNYSKNFGNPNGK